jgi:hypothetical protein
LKNARGYKEREAVRSMLEARMRVEPAPEEVMAHVVAHQHPIRERCWIEAITKYLDNEILFVCGDIHIYTFSRALEQLKVRSKIVAQGIGVDLSCLGDYNGLSYALAKDMLNDSRCFCTGS